jgi:hypothetical protein
MFAAGLFAQRWYNGRTSQQGMIDTVYDIEEEVRGIRAVQMDHQRLMTSVVKRPRMNTTTVARFNTDPA